jgi:hypothetical protein
MIHLKQARNRLYEALKLSKKGAIKMKNISSFRDDIEEKLPFVEVLRRELLLH